MCVQTLDQRNNLSQQMQQILVLALLNSQEERPLVHLIIPAHL